MNGRTLKIAGAVVLSLCVVIIVGIYTPKLIKQINEKRQKIKEEQQKSVGVSHLKLSLKASEKIIAAIETWSEIEWDTETNFKPHTETGTEASVALTKASEGVQLRIEELRSLNEKNALPKSVIETNIVVNLKLDESLIALDEEMKALTEEFQRFNEEKTEARSLMNRIYGVLNVTRLLVETISEATDAHEEYQRARRTKARPWWFR